MTNTQHETGDSVVETKLGRFEEFYGHIHKNMQRLLTGKESKEGPQIDFPRTLVSPKRLMELRLGKVGSEADQKMARDYSFSTSLAVLVDPESEEATFSHRHPLIYTLDKDTELLDGGRLDFDRDVYESAKKDGFTISASNVHKLRKGYALPNVKREAWEFFAEGDIQLLKEYTEHVLQEKARNSQTFASKAREKKLNDVMGIRTKEYPQDKGLNLVMIDSSADGGRSDADGAYGFYGRYLALSHHIPIMLGESLEKSSATKSGMPLENRVEFADDMSRVKVDDIDYVIKP